MVGSLSRSSLPVKVKDRWHVVSALDAAHSARVGKVDRLIYFLRSRGVQVVVLALVANTMVAQLLYNSAGRLVLGSWFLLGYLLFSAVCSTVAFALFEISTIFQLHDLMALDATIKVEIGAEKLIKRGWLVLGVSSLINFVSVLYFLALAWHTHLGHVRQVPAGRPAAALELALLRAACAGLHRRPLPGGHLRRAAQERERGRPRHAAGVGAAGVGTVALAEGGADRGDDARRHPARRGRRRARLSPETAERIALMEAATSGSMSALDAAFLSVKRAGHDTSVLDGLRATNAPPPAATALVEEAEAMLVPLGLGGRSSS